MKKKKIQIINYKDIIFIVFKTINIILLLLKYNETFSR